MIRTLLKTASPLGVLLALGVVGANAAGPAQAPAADPGKAIVNRACQTCHDLGMVTEARHTAEGWTSVIQRMRGNGADLTDEDAKKVQAYLTKLYGKPG